MTKEEVLEAVRRMVLIERALYVPKSCVLLRPMVTSRLPKATVGHVHWALSELAKEGIMHTRGGPEGAVQSYDRGSFKRFAVRISRRDAIERCKAMGVDFTKEHGFNEDIMNSTRTRPECPRPYYAHPVIDPWTGK